MKNEVLNKHALKVGLFLAILYVVCLLWRVLLTDSEAVVLHLKALKIAFPGFQGYDIMSIIWGAVLTWVYGFVGSYIFHSLHTGCCGMKK